MEISWNLGLLFLWTLVKEFELMKCTDFPYRTARTRMLLKTACVGTLKKAQSRMSNKEVATIETGNV